MPKIQRADIPPGIIIHLLRRSREREISEEDLKAVLQWIERNPTVPFGDWYKRFQNLTVCGQDGQIKTFLTPKQTAIGSEVE